MGKQLNDQQKNTLLKLARNAIEHYLATGRHLSQQTEDETLQEKRGAFVTLKQDNQLRGCIGYALPYKPLYETIIDVSVSAAFHDFRFPPLTKEELPQTKIEISVLTPPQKIEDVNQIEIGKHGIIITKGMHKGLLLPQVPVEWGWDVETFLSNGCRKAGLDEDEWKREAQIEIFSAQVFSE
ncbi:AmmeMemoRadiSam system protein A [bacterium]|nr:AmmeMemoRadiSam system protein A [bacterium]